MFRSRSRRYRSLVRTLNQGTRRRSGTHCDRRSPRSRYLRLRRRCLKHSPDLFQGILDERSVRMIWQCLRALELSFSSSDQPYGPRLLLSTDEKLHQRTDDHQEDSFPPTELRRAFDRRRVRGPGKSSSHTLHKGLFRGHAFPRLQKIVPTHGTRDNCTA